MKKIIQYFILLLLTFELTGLYAQEKSLPNFDNPFGKKKNSVNYEVIRPSAKIDGYSSKYKSELPNGSFYFDLQDKNIKTGEEVRLIEEVLNKNHKYTFVKDSEKTDDLNIIHSRYQQYYKGFEVEGGVFFIHSKDGNVNSVNGRIFDLHDLDISIEISDEKAISIAKEYLAVDKLIREYEVQNVVTTIPDIENSIIKLAKKVRIDSYSPFEMCYIYVDVQTGEILNKVNLISHADVPGTGQTFYSGNQSITCDSYSGHYRLRESARNIETFDATLAYNLDTTGFIGAFDFINSSTSWSGGPKLDQFSINTVSQNWWYTIFADETPDLYIKVKDGNNATVYISTLKSNTFPPVTFQNLNIHLTTPPYTIELWDFDVVGGDDFGGSYVISTITGSSNYSGNGNNGSYIISNSGHPALDVHWGMEKTYDFFLNVLNRSSFDGNGSKIKNYINPPNYQSQNGYNPNNAGALAAPYNIMMYGIGDGLTYNPIVGLDVEGHEFTHLVVANNGNGGLIYQGESGALNESFADIFGTSVEFYSGVNPDWNIGENLKINSPFMRSMSNPNAADHPDTYNGLHWKNPSNLSDGDHGGVHTNSGVQNFWFYLLSEGGSGINDLNNNYSVTGIGIAQAQQIAYRNLIYYLGPNSTYMDAYYGSIQAAEDLYGNPSPQYTAVKQAWYAVGIGNDPNSYCSGTSYYTDLTNTITDGSGNANYNSNSNCKWVIAPPGANQISLTFSAFDTEADYDTVFVYDGPDDTYPLLAIWWGNTLPPLINTTSGTGAMCIKFKSDNTVTAGGWTANYTTIGITPSCSGGSVLSTPTGSFNDGSASSNYGNNQLCYWYIAPPCASSVTLSFSQFQTELNYDGLIIFDDLNGINQLAVLSGTNLPASITSSTGKMLVIFVSDYSFSMQGFSANYTSTSSPYCSGVTNMNISDYGTFSDGSGSNNYCNNMNCSWLIQPPQATSVTLNFTSFDLEDASIDGQTIYDFVEVYDGTTTSAPLLGRFTGSNLPPAITSTGGSMFIKFITDLEVTKQGFNAYYTSTQNPYCSGTATLTTTTGTFDDGSGSSDYANNSYCSWLIQPANVNSISLSFTNFSTALNYDGVIVYDGANNSAPVIGQYSGSSIPPLLTSTGGSLYVEFLSDPSIRSTGWSASYTSTPSAIAPVANFNANNNNICEGVCIDFFDNSTNTPTTWNWSFPGANPSSSGIQNPTSICYNTPGTYNVMLTVSNGAGSDNKTINGYITVKAEPTIPVISVSPSNSICYGDTATLTVTNPCTNCNYLWNPNNKTGINNFVINNGSYSVIATNNCGQKTSSPVNMTVNSLPSVPTISVNGNQLMSSAQSGNQWYLNNALIPGATQQVYTILQTGNYHVEVTDNNNCSSESDVILVSLVGIRALNDLNNTIQIFPNPSDGLFKIKVDFDDVNIQIVDILGKEIAKPIHAKKGDVEFDLRHLSDGMYFVKFKIGDSFYIKPIIKN